MLKRFVSISFFIYCFVIPAVYFVAGSKMPDSDFQQLTGAFSAVHFAFAALPAVYYAVYVHKQAEGFVYAFRFFLVPLCFIQLVPAFCYFVFNGYNYVPWLNEGIGITAHWIYFPDTEAP